jgi:lipopolysaccharide/colanic/teichoic acid biosynthesis glycosyltransferase
MENDRNLLKTTYLLPTRPPNGPRWTSRAAKRLFDILAAALGLIILSPVLGLLSLLIKRDSPGPVLYRGPRMGMGGRAFDFHNAGILL